MSFVELSSIILIVEIFMCEIIVLVLRVFLVDSCILLLGIQIQVFVGKNQTIVDELGTSKKIHGFSGKGASARHSVPPTCEVCRLVSGEPRHSVHPNPCYVV